MPPSDELAQALASGYEEVVEVNQRGLIDKVLARYSGEYTVFRELLQNADDANATSIEVHYETDSGAASVNDWATRPIAKIAVKNDGHVFRDEDWRRLRTIADGQPDVARIGAFGVGYYSVFSACDEPLVISGPSMMLFFWKGDQLAVKRAANPRADQDVTSEGKPWTTVSLPCREPVPMPSPADFSRFLATALAFTANIRSMALFFDKHEMCRLVKKAAPASPIQIPSSTITRSPQRYMGITGVESTPVQIDCRALRATIAAQEKPKKVSQTIKESFATKFLNFATSKSASQSTPAIAESPTEQYSPLEVMSASLFLRLVSAEVAINAPAAFVAEIERSTKKQPPKRTQVRLLFASKDEAAASEAGPAANDLVSSVQSIFSGLSQGPGKQGRIFIGFPTHQQTGFSGSVAAQFLPTVERESLDLQARHVAEYNRELLAISGILQRIVYDSEMQDIKALFLKLGQDSQDKEDPARGWLADRASHLMQFFTFHASTPLAEVGAVMQRSFFACNTKELLLISTQGVLTASRVRLPAPELSFLTGLPVVPDSVAKANATLLDQLQDRDILRHVTIDDVIAQLDEKALSPTAFISCLQWWIGLTSNASYDPRLLNRLRNAAVVSIEQATGGTTEERIIAFSNVKTFINPRTLPPDLPVPQDVIPYEISRAFEKNDLQRVFGLSELSVLDWTRYLVSGHVIRNVDTSITLSAPFSERVLNTLAKIWPNLPATQTAQIVDILKPTSCIPTKKGMQLPSESYFPKVTLFEDLPVTTLNTKGNMEKLLTSLGVRKHVDLQLVFSRLLGGGQWEQEQVAKYLVSVMSGLSAEETDRLKKTAWLTREEPQTGTVKLDGSPQPPSRYKARSLYEPNDTLRELGLPILAWNAGKWRSNSDEARLLFSMGLKKHPETDEILTLAADVAQPEKQKKALVYFLNNFETVYSQPYQPSKHAIAFVPVIKDGKETFAKPLEAYSSPGSSIMGFATLRPEYQLHAAKFKIAADPKPSDLVAGLVNSPPKTTESAVPIFSYLAGQASRYSAQDYSVLSNARFVPVQKEKDGPYHHYTPKSVYFKTQEESITSKFRDLFNFVDFGMTGNAFLLQCGVRSEPTTAELTQLLLNDPRHFLTLAGSSETYITLLRQIAAHYANFSNALRRRMKDTPFILGFERIASGKTTQQKSLLDQDDDDEDDSLLQYRLGLASEVVIIDDTTTLNDFRDHILSCPQDDLIEAFVEQLGGKRISRLVTTNLASSPIPETASPRALQLRKLILERVTLFLHERHQTSKDVRYNEEWLGTHMVVKEVTRIERQRVLTLGVSRFVKTSPASAAATVEKGTLLLRISSNLNDLDYYEVAAALTGIMLNRQRIHDTLLFMTLLQTSLRDLKRRGFNVDRIVNARKAEQEAIEQKRREERAEAELQRIKDLEKPKALPPPAYNENGSQDLHNLDRKETTNGEPSSPLPSLPGGLPGGPFGRSLFDSFRNKLKANKLMPPMAIESMTGESQASVERQAPALPPVPPSKGGLQPSQPDDRVSPRSNIETNVFNAISASRPDRSGNITSDVETKEVKESESYCDSTPASDLDYVTDISGIRFYISRSVEPDENILQKRADSIKTYITQVVKPVGNIFNVDPKALHVFYDKTGPLIAFNRSGSLFLNYRYADAWFGAQMRENKFEEALISTYFSLAHELAHNLVLPHNSEHSFYTSQIAQTYFIPFAGYVAQQMNRASTEPPNV